MTQWSAYLASIPAPSGAAIAYLACALVLLPLLVTAWSRS